jgi:hypothetical protein
MCPRRLLIESQHSDLDLLAGNVHVSVGNRSSGAALSTRRFIGHGLILSSKAACFAAVSIAVSALRRASAIQMLGRVPRLLPATLGRGHLGLKSFRKLSTKSFMISRRCHTALLIS